MPATTGPRPLGSNYILDECIGAGAQGTVWRGRRLAHGHRSEQVLAFKLLRSELIDDPGVVERFIKERSTLMRVRSPHVVGIQDLVIEGATFGIVMDYVSGGDLRGLLRDAGVLAPGDVAGIGAKVAAGLAAVHEAGVVHRDVKPANVLLEATSPGALGEPRLADFGVARICDTVATRATGSVGTPVYIAPEIVAGQEPTPATDIYSLGIVLYEMSCGTPPFLGQIASLLSQHIRRDPGRPTGIPDPLWDLIAQMLAKQPDARPSAPQVAASLNTMAPALTGIVPAPALTSPPRSRPAAQPYTWDEDEAPAPQDTPPTPETQDTTPLEPGEAPASGAPTRTEVMNDRVGEVSATRAYRAPDSAQAPNPPIWTVVDPRAANSPAPDPATAAYGSIAPPRPGPRAHHASVPSPVTQYSAPGVPSPAHPAAPGPSGPVRPAGRRRRDRRRRWWVVVVVLVTVVAVAAAGTWWWLDRSGAQAYQGWPAALPSGNSVREDQRFPDVSEFVLSEDGSLLVVSSSSTISLYDLTNVGSAPVWTGECDDSGFWDSSTVLCTGDTDLLISSTGSTSRPNGPIDLNLQGTTSDMSILIDDSSSGALVALSGHQEAWRLYGKYKAARASNGFVVAYEDERDVIQVISAASGAILAEQDGYTGDFKDDQHPGGFGIDAGTEAFYQVTGSGVVVYNADGTEYGRAGALPAGTDMSHACIAGAPMSAERLLAAFNAVADGLQVYGVKDSVIVTTDTTACTIAVGGVTLAIPKRSKGEVCRTNALGLVNGDDAVLVQVGQYSSSSGAVGDSVGAYSRKDGSALWQATGEYVGVVAPAAGQRDSRLLVRQGGDDGDLVVLRVVKSG